MDTKNEPTVVFAEVEVSKIVALRHSILRPGLPLNTASFDGDNDRNAYHFAAFIPEKEGETPLCCLSLMLNSFRGRPAWQLRGMATSEKYARQGLAKGLTQFAEETVAIESEISLFWCNARVESIGFYEKQGWSCVSKEFDIPGVGPHVKMIHEL